LYLTVNLPIMTDTGVSVIPFAVKIEQNRVWSSGAKQSQSGCRAG